MSTPAQVPLLPEAYSTWGNSNVGEHSVGTTHRHTTNGAATYETLLLGFVAGIGYPAPQEDVMILRASLGAQVQCQPHSPPDRHSSHERGTLERSYKHNSNERASYERIKQSVKGEGKAYGIPPWMVLDRRRGLEKYMTLYSTKLMLHPCASFSQQAVYIFSTVLLSSITEGIFIKLFQLETWIRLMDVTNVSVSFFRQCTWCTTTQSSTH